MGLRWGVLGCLLLIAGACQSNAQRADGNGSGETGGGGAQGSGGRGGSGGSSGGGGGDLVDPDVFDTGGGSGGLASGEGEVTDPHADWPMCDGVPTDTQRDSTHCGTCDNRCAPVVLATGPRWPLHIELSATHAYWITGGNEGAVMRVPLAGGAATMLAQGQSFPHGFAMDATHLYWGAGSRIRKMPIEGGTVVDLVTAQMNPQDVAVDDTGVYFTNHSGADAAEIMKVGLDGGTPVTLATDPDASPTAIAVDDTGIYWAHGYSGAGRRVLTVPLAGGTPTVLASGSYNVFALGIDGDNVYFTTFDGLLGSSVRSVPLGGGGEVTLATGSPQPMAMTVTADSVYWVNVSSAYTYGGLDNSDGTVMGVPLGGGAATTLAPRERDPSDIASNGRTVCWVNYGDDRVQCLSACDGGVCQ